jgi:hypothetical protein
MHAGCWGLEFGGIGGIIGAENNGSRSVKKIVLRSLLFWVTKLFEIRKSAFLETPPTTRVFSATC